jgi:hypothetical protein
MKSIVRKPTLLLAVLVLAFGLLPGAQRPALADAVPCVVTDPANDATAAGTLNYWLAAVGADGSTPACGMITFNGDMTVLGPVLIDHDVTLDGEMYNVTITGDTDGDGGADQSLVIISAQGPNVTLQNLTLTSGGGSDGPVYNNGTLTLNHVKVLDNVGGYGSILNLGTLNVVDSYFSTSHPDYLHGIVNFGTLNVTRTTFSGNTSAVDNNSYAGYFSPTATITDSTFVNNTAFRAGAIVANHNQGTLTISGSTFNGNTTTPSDDQPLFPQGVLWNEAGGTSVVTNSTFSGNTITGLVNGFGTIAIRNFGSMILKNNTFANNRFPGAFTLYDDNRLDPNGTIQLLNNVFVDDPDPAVCAYSFYPFIPNVSSNNLFTGYCGLTGEDARTPEGFTLKTHAEINLGTLGDNGGPTQTIPLLPGSAAIDAGDNTNCPATDQRGVTRPQGAGCDAGAYEVELPAGITISGTVWNDENGNQVIDPTETGLSGWTVELTQCNVYGFRLPLGSTITGTGGTYSFTNVKPIPSDYMYCIDLDMQPDYERTGGSTTIDPARSDPFSGKNIGVNIPSLLYEPADHVIHFPDGKEATREIKVTGGEAPYTFEILYGQDVPANLTASFSTAEDGTGIWSFTGTLAYNNTVDVRIKDARGWRRDTYFHFVVDPAPVYQLTSSNSSSNLNEAVTFTFSGALPEGSTYPYPPIGTVEFQVDGTDINGCEQVLLNLTVDAEGNPAAVGDIPATCTTSALRAGSHTITASFTTYQGLPFAPATLTLTQVVGMSANCTVSGWSGTYDGQPHGASGSCTGPDGVTLLGLDLGATFTNVPGGTAHWTFSGGSNYTAQSGDVTINISKANAMVTLSDLTQTADGSPKPATVTTDPAGLSVNVTYNGSSTPPSASGSYAVVATVNDANYQGTASGTLVINPEIPRYTSMGFTAPLDLGGVLNQAKAGQMIPLKWRLLDGSGNPVTNLTSSDVTPTVSAYSCPSGVTVDEIETYATGTTALQNLGNGYYQLNWKTDKAWVNTCKRLTLKIGGWTGDGFAVLFQFKK